jgi:hypothetical protein
MTRALLFVRQRQPSPRPHGRLARGVIREVGGLTLAFVATRKPASTVLGEQSDRQLSAGASRPTCE